MPSASYQSAGVNYDQLDAFKRNCQKAAAGTVSALAARGMTEPAGIRGESAYLVETPDTFLAHVEEGLGTKNVVADAMLKLTGTSYYVNIGIDTVATIVNDLVTTGALPISVAMHAAVGDAAWFANTTRAQDLAKGFAQGCRKAGAVWGGGETPALRDIIAPEAAVLAGSAMGQIQPKSNRISGNVRDGDAIVLLASSGVHTNGLTLCRAIADRLSRGYLTTIPDGRCYGAALLDASIIYAPFIAACQKSAIQLHYAVHITGHGWRKLMRLAQPFVYRMTNPGQPQPIFQFLMESGPIDPREAYATFNMGAGFAVYVDPADAATCVRLAGDCDIEAWIGGSVQQQGQRKAVELPTLGITFEAESLQVR